MQNSFLGPNHLHLNSLDLIYGQLQSSQHLARAGFNLSANKLPLVAFFTTICSFLIHFMRDTRWFKIMDHTRWSWVLVCAIRTEQLFAHVSRLVCCLEPCLWINSLRINLQRLFEKLSKVDIRNQNIDTSALAGRITFPIKGLDVSSYNNSTGTSYVLAMNVLDVTFMLVLFRSKDYWYFYIFDRSINAKSDYCWNFIPSLIKVTFYSFVLTFASSNCSLFSPCLIWSTWWSLKLWWKS